MHLSSATTFQPWADNNIGDNNNGGAKFQFGHGFSAMDMATIFRPLLISKKADFHACC